MTLLTRQNKTTTSHSPSFFLVSPGVYHYLLFFSFASLPVAIYSIFLIIVYQSPPSIRPICLSVISSPRLSALSVGPWERLLLCGHCSTLGPRPARHLAGARELSPEECVTRVQL